MRLSISHMTEYHYEMPVPYGLQELRLTPQSGYGQTVLDWRLIVEGGKIEADFNDQHGNFVSLVSFDEDLHVIQVRCEGVVETEDRAGVSGAHFGYAPLWFFKRQTPSTAAGDGVKALVAGLSGFEPGSIGALHVLAAAVADAVDYQSGWTGATTNAEDALKGGKGVCQDQAHVFLSAARAMGFPARYVSGYLYMDDRSAQEASHAWAEAYVEGLGWVGFDVANRISPDERYVRIATGLDYRDAAPISGMRYGSGGESLKVALRVEQQQ